MDVKARILNGEYNNKQTFVSINENPSSYIKYCNEEEDIKYRLKNDLETQFDTPKQIADKVFSISWNLGHSRGHLSVFKEYETLVFLMKNKVYSEKCLDELI